MNNVQSVQAELRDINTIYPYEKNVKKHPKEQVDKIAASIRKFGWRGNPIAVNKHGVILAGHGRRLAALQLGLEKVPVVVYADMTEEEERAFRLSDNRAAQSDIDALLLQEEVFDLGIDMLDGIFDDKELDFFMVEDLGTMNEEAFADDLAAVTQEQSQDTASAIEAADASEIPLARLFGFKSIRGADAIHVTRFLASIEEETGLEGRDALIAFAQQHWKNK